MYGLDFSGPLIDVARHRVDNDEPGHFWRADIRHVAFFPSEEFDHGKSFRVFMADVLAAWGEMARVIVQSMYWSEAIVHFRGRARLAPAQFIC